MFNKSGEIVIVDLMDKLHKITTIGLSTREKQKFINVSEVFYAWDVLTLKLDILETVQLTENFVDDIDLKYILGKIVDGLQSGINDMEYIMINYGVPFPIRPPAGSNITLTLEQLSDRDVFQALFEAIQAFFPILSSGFINSTSADIRKSFKNHIITTMELQEMLVEYGKLKGYLHEPPVYRA